MATKSKKTTDKYKPNQFVVHPHHGAAKVVRKINKNVEIFDENGDVKSKRRQYFEIEVLTDGLLVMVPVENVDEVIRPVISKNADIHETTNIGPFCIIGDGAVSYTHLTLPTIYSV